MRTKYELKSCKQRKIWKNKKKKKKKSKISLT